MTREEANAEVQRKRLSEPGVAWIATRRDGEWTVARIGLTPISPTGTATKPAPTAPPEDPHTPLERGAWFAGA